MMEDLSLHVLDIAENAVSAGATRVLIAVNENAARDVLTIRVTDNGRALASDGDVHVRLPEPRPSVDGRQVLLGVRPEHLETCDVGAASMQPDIDFIELLGSDSLVYGHLGADKRGARVAARLHTSVVARAGRLPLHFAAEHMHLFDPETGRRIEA